MVRYAFALRGQAKDQGHEIRIKEQPVEIIKAKEQLSEHYLCDINANGEVPVLVPLDSGKPIPESVDITKHLAESYPSMIPDSCGSEIKQLIYELHGISFFAFTFAGKPQGIQATKARLEGLQKEPISDQYRAAIDIKLQRLKEKKFAVLTPQASRKNEEYAAQLMTRLESLLNASQTPWLFGLERPSALDAHLLVFIARMQDIGRGDMIPEALKKYGEKAMNGPEWHEVMQGRHTSPL
ncbi:hypothetical protein B0A54_17911 [Friedmanniomyces endolithicus]|uniref:GST N-terminal domain-containing protein n=1 Tax=Friedmanniomyces endolithicus TaxID=329885 RepID=A0A4V5N3I0_9PEZI|nr:hypothetical protein LTS09_017855 [Friedmanniomyces endolithicus]TKA23739.1 hypothetical protein B0A54_17911 [Friedmanniomyces endolithicus]